MSDTPYMVKMGEAAASGGVFTGSFPCQAITDLTNLGVSWLVYQVMWRHIDPNATGNIANYVLGNFDAVVSQCNQAGINVMLALFTPPNAFISPGTSLCATPSSMATYAQNIARAYTTGSGFQRGTRHIQGLYIGNEDYDSGAYPTEAPQLVSVMKATYPVVKAVNSNIKVVAAGKIQRNSDAYTGWFDTLLNRSTGAYIGGVFQADAITFHYHTAQPYDPSTHVPLSPDPRVDVGKIPSYQTCWKLIDAKRQQYNNNVEVWSDEVGMNVNTNPAGPTRYPESVISPSLRWTYHNWMLDSARLSGVVTKYGIFTVGEYAGYPSPNYRDGQSIVQGPLGAGSIYDDTYRGVQTYITNHSSWTANILNLTTKARSKFKTYYTGLGSRARSKFKTRMGLRNTPHSTFITKLSIRTLVSNARSTFKINTGSIRNLLTRARSKFFTRIIPDGDPDYATQTLSAIDGTDTFTAIDGQDSFNGIG